MAAVSMSAAAVAVTVAPPVVKKDIEARVKELIAVADKKFKLSDADIDKTYAGKQYTEVKGRSKIYICKYMGDPAALIPVLFKNKMAYLVLTLVSNQQLPLYYIFQDNNLYVVKAIDQICLGAASDVQIQLEGKS